MARHTGQTSYAAVFLADQPKAAPDMAFKAEYITAKRGPGSPSSEYLRGGGEPRCYMPYLTIAVDVFQRVFIN